MSRLDWVDHREDPAAWARSLGVSTQACELLLASDFLDLHVVVEVPVRLYGYRPDVRHPPRERPPWLFGHTDFPRLREAGYTGVVYDITTNPFRGAASRLAVTRANLDAALARIRAWPDDLAVVTTRAGYDAARAAGKLALFLSLQGGNAVSADPSALEGELGRLLVRITLVHLTTSDLGGTSSPLGRDAGITARGREVVAACNAARVIVDLAHAGKATFWGALEAHAPDLPPIVSHTGVCGATPHWRNLDDDQVRAIADRGGVVGIIYHRMFLGGAGRDRLVAHLEHLVDVGGEDAAALGSDYDGFIVPPVDLADVTHHPKLVQDLLDRGWSEARIRKVLGENWLRVVREARPGRP